MQQEVTCRLNLLVFSQNYLCMAIRFFKYNGACQMLQFIFFCSRQKQQCYENDKFNFSAFRFYAIGKK